MSSLESNLARDLLLIRRAETRTEGITKVNLVLNQLLAAVNACKADQGDRENFFASPVSSCPPEKRVRYYPTAETYEIVNEKLFQTFNRILQFTERPREGASADEIRAEAQRKIAAAFAAWRANDFSDLIRALRAPEINLVPSEYSGTEEEKIAWSRNYYSAVLASLVVNSIIRVEHPEGEPESDYFPAYNSAYLSRDEFSGAVFDELASDLTPEQALIFNAFVEEMQGAQTGGASEWFQLILEINALASYFRAKSADLSIRCEDSSQRIDFEASYRRLLTLTSQVFSNIRGSALRGFEAQGLSPEQMDEAARKLFEAEEASFLERANLENLGAGVAGSGATTTSYLLAAELGGMGALTAFAMSIPPALLFGYLAFEMTELVGFTRSLKALRESWDKLTIIYRTALEDPCNPAVQNELGVLSNDLADRCKYAESKKTCHLKHIGISVGGIALIYLIGKPLVEKLR